jgi:hypothetical protein
MQLLKNLRVLFLFLLLAASAAAQHTISGQLKDSLTDFPISGATITNATRRLSVQTDVNGLFRIRVAPDDVLYAVAPLYRYDTLRYSSLSADTLTIYLAPAGSLMEEVTVRAHYSKYQADSIERRTDWEELRGQRLSTVSRASQGFGVSLNLDKLFKKKYRNPQDDEEKFRITEERAYVRYRFSPQLVASYTRLRGEELRSFLYRYTPDYEWLRAHPSNESVIFYISEKLQAFRKEKNK